MKLTKWSPLLDIGMECPIFFLNLCPHLFSPHILHGLDSLFGWPLKVDNVICKGSRPSVVCVLVALDITKSFPNKILLDPEKLGYIQQVIMDEFPPFCALCKCIGHSNVDCRPHPSSAPINVGINSVKPSGNFVENTVVVNAIINVESLDHNAVPAPVNVNESTQENVVLNVESLDNNSSLNDSPAFHEKQGEVGEVNNFLVNLITSPLTSPCVHVDVNPISNTVVYVDKAAIFNDFVPQELGDCVVVPPVGELVNVDCGDVGNAMVTPMRFSASSSIGFDPAAINVVSPMGELDAATCNRDVEDSNGALHDRIVVEYAVIPLGNLALTSTFVDISISVVSNAELKAHLAWSDFQDMYSYMVGRIVDLADSSGVGNRHPRLLTWWLATSNGCSVLVSSVAVGFPLLTLSPDVVVPLNGNDVPNLVCLDGPNAMSDGALLSDLSPRGVSTPMVVECLKEEDIVACEPLVGSANIFNVLEDNLHDCVPSVCEANSPVGPVALSPAVVVPQNGNDVPNLVCLDGPNAVSDGALLSDLSPKGVSTYMVVECSKEEDIVPCEVNRVVEQELSSGSAYTISVLNSPILALTVAPVDQVPTPVLPSFQLSGQLVEVPVNLISLDALVSHVGISSGESVRMQIDWLECSSPSSSEANEVECLDQQDIMHEENVWVGKRRKRKSKK
ncbi:hypothetical protein IEQ34_004658 [Dendrobium chrysotoxum]|uniref:DUF4283 domain-containing protein n=1 Tax=Dendrobium chrysotoxum TaxID=161865 RepID=A0AAV7HJE5_DENCH|nr:hypothetical protein IEQ34_004658 [Dendrobium chrysotoxum]